ncbi:putative rrna processing protein [Phaeoacremonium minimum UCRPA7]|uniref:Putative rrna processing protein n=1 Tax=Phaeoacremonium minimum (strain UCR-PA7) TaxID=1286976 RepID=R8BWX9_PHAM7|nr:putative rrna processing protein [Phaeoacremonium minimum UCRPA7]EOO03863.1 putative rrna processing protein [Phaeoacremonium minimum UCRPA7]
MPKATTPNAADRRRHNPLEADILGGTGTLRNKAPKRKSRSKEEAEENFVDSKASRKILRIGRELIEEDRLENPVTEPAPSAFDSRFDFEDEEHEVFDDDNDEAWGDEDDVVEEIEIAPDDLDTFNKFLPNPSDEDDLLKHGWDGPSGEEEPSGGAGGANLADIILAKIAAFESSSGPRRDVQAPDEYIEEELPPKVIEVYEKVGMILSRWRSGPLPKPIKILPSIPNWERILEVTKPEEWTPNACYALTRIFVSSKAGVIQRFLEMVILDRVRDDIYETKKLNVHLYNSLKKSLYKPAAFFKGFLFPLVGSGTCTLREAHIISSVLARVSIPVLHSAAGLKGLCDIAAQQASLGTEGGGACNVFIKTLLDKRYALPFQVVDSLVFHFLRFRAMDPASIKDEDAMAGLSEGAMAHRLPVIWHQCLLSFASRYRNDITEDQREALLDLLLTHGHSAIGPEIRRELLAGRGRGVPLEPPAATFDGDDTMQVDS